MNRAVFLDRDGVIIRQMEVVCKPEQLKILKDSGKAIKLLNNLGFRVVVVTNQPQVAKNQCTERDVRKVNESLRAKLMKSGAKVDAIYFCPHHPERQHRDIIEKCRKYRIACECRKPDIGMLLKAKKKFNIDIHSSFIVGDRTVDVQTGKNAGCKTILVKTGYAGSDKKYDAKPDFICRDLYRAAKLIEGFV
ncbi:MAG: HAD family hydrolase [Candidatus Aenigmatarchaeota archaeon]